MINLKKKICASDPKFVLGKDRGQKVWSHKEMWRGCPIISSQKGFYDAEMLDCNCLDSAKFSLFNCHLFWGISRNTSGQGWKPWADQQVVCCLSGKRWSLKSPPFFWKKLSQDDQGGYSHLLLEELTYNSGNLRKWKPMVICHTLLDIGWVDPWWKAGCSTTSLQQHQGCFGGEIWNHLTTSIRKTRALTALDA